MVRDMRENYKVKEVERGRGVLEYCVKVREVERWKKWLMR